jgi:hypothetical protein
LAWRPCSIPRDRSPSLSGLLTGAAAAPGRSTTSARAPLQRSGAVAARAPLRQRARHPGDHRCRSAACSATGPRRG